GGATSLELNAADEELLTLVDVDHEINNFLVLIYLRVWERGEINVAQLAVGFTHVLQAFAHVRCVEDFSILHGKKSSQRLDVIDCLVALESDGSQVIAVAFLNRDSDVHRLA